MSSASMKPWPSCNCASYNAATPGDPEVILTIKDYFPEMISDRETVCVDRCIAPVVQLLWQAGIWTLNSCCGHNKEAPSIITEQPDAERALSLLLKGGFPQVRVLAWNLCDMRIPVPGAMRQSKEDRELITELRADILVLQALEECFDAARKPMIKHLQRAVKRLRELTRGA